MRDPYYEFVIKAMDKLVLASGAAAAEFEDDHGPNHPGTLHGWRIAEDTAHFACSWAGLACLRYERTSYGR